MKTKSSAERGWKTRQRKEKRGGNQKELEMRNSRDVQKQYGTGKAAEALSVLLRVLAWTFPNSASSKVPQISKHPSTTPRCRASGPGGRGRGADLSWEAAEEEVEEEVGGWGAAAVP